MSGWVARPSDEAIEHLADVLIDIARARQREDALAAAKARADAQAKRRARRLAKEQGTDRP